MTASTQARSSVDVSNDLTLELCVLGGMVIFPTVARAAADRLSSEMFYASAHGQTFDVLAALVRADEPRDPVTLAAELRRRQMLDTVGGEGFVAVLPTFAESEPASLRAVRIVGELAVCRKMSGVGSMIAELGRSAPADVDAAIRQAEGMIAGLRADRREDRFVSIGEALSDVLDETEKLYEAGEELTGLPTGFIDLDEMTMGMRPGEVHLVAGRPGSGKSVFGANTAVHVAASGRPVLLASMEMRARELARRILACEARVDKDRLKSGRLSSMDWEKISRATGALSSMPLWIDDAASQTISHVRSRIQRVKREAGGIALAVVDHAHLMDAEGRVSGDIEKLSQITRGFKMLAMDENLVVMPLAQLNRGTEGRNDHRPSLGDLRGSGSFEQDADAVLFVYRDEMYRKDTEDAGIAEIIVAKQRDGSLGTVRLAFLGQYSKFANMARDH